MSLIVGIVGASGAGKTTIANQLSEHYKERALIVAEDTYFKGKKSKDENIDQPSAVDHNLLLAHLKELKAGRAVEQPIYDYHTGSRKAEIKTIHPSEIIIVEGLFLLSHPKLSEMFNLKIFIQTPKDLAWKRRVERDEKERSLSVKDNLKFYSDVRKGYLTFIRPYKNHADIVIDNSKEESMDKNLQQIINKIVF